VERTTPIAAQRPVTVPSQFCCTLFRFKKAVCLNCSTKSSLYAVQLNLVMFTHAHAQGQVMAIGSNALSLRSTDTNVLVRIAA
jgi:hypothetical protein